MRLLSNAAVLDVRERVSNFGGVRLAYQWGHHISIGAPFFSAACALAVPASRVIVPEYARTLRRRLPLGPEWKPNGVNQLWVTDITYIRLRESFLYLAVILDAYSRRVIGWAIGYA